MLSTRLGDVQMGSLAEPDGERHALRRARNLTLEIVERYEAVRVSVGFTESLVDDGSNLRRHMGITPGTPPIIDGLPAERRSVASAVNDITREVGGVLGIAVLSSILISFYRGDIKPALDGLPAQVREIVDAGAGAAVGIADSFGPQGEALALAAREAFATGLSASMFVGAVVLAAAAVITFVVAPGKSK